MDLLRIEGGTALSGTVDVSGSKNAALPAMAACLLTSEPLELRNVPDIEDIETLAAILEHLGVTVDRISGSEWRLEASGLTNTPVGAELSHRLRGSFLLLGALVARTGYASIARPGGDDIGMRRVEQHLEGLRLMGADVEESGDAHTASAKGLHGARIDLDMPTVTGTENLMMAAAIASGITVISNAAREPHVVDLARCLAAMGARITGAGTELLVIEGNAGLLHGARHTLTSDYIEAGTYMVAAAATGGDITADHVRQGELRFLTSKLRAAGAEVVEGSDHIRVHGGGHLRSIDVTTWPHPGFATDLQSQWVALMTQAEGVSVVSEALFENRFRHVEQLRRLGADVTVEGRSAVVRGPSLLHGARVAIPDIRGGAALVIAALCAEGTTELENVFQLDRGYEDFERKLRELGATIERQTTTSEQPASRDLSGVIGD